MHLSGCKNLKEITIPQSVTTIKEFAFLDSGLKNINVIGYTETPNDWEEKWNLIDSKSNSFCSVTWNKNTSD